MLDIKLKNNNIEKLINTIGVLCCIGLVALAMILSYPVVREYGQKSEINFFDNYEMSRELAKINYVLYYNTLNENKSDYVSPAETLIAENASQYTQADFTYQAERFNELIKHYNRYNMTSLENLDFLARNSENGVSKKSNRDISKMPVENYQFYLEIQFDEKGNMTIQKSYGTDDLYNQEHMMDYVDDIFNCRYFEMAPIKNMTYTYGVPKELTDSDFISRGVFRSKNSSYVSGIAGMFMVSSLIVIVVGLLTPSSKAKQIVGFNTITRIPLEINFVIGFFSMAAIIGFIDSILGEFVRTGTLRFFENIGFSSGVIVQMTYFIWVLVFAMAFWIGLIMRYIAHRGIFRYLRENSIIGRILTWIFRGIRKLILSCGEIDLREKNTKVILKIVLFNGVVLTAIAVTWVFGLIGVVVYSIFLFIFMRRKVNHVGDQYNKLLEVTEKIAEGHLEVKIEEDLGLFENIKDNLERIQDGFKKAVEEEVKSQRMKTELISNVSHDLKTPLTAIITYVDLLKDRELPEDKHTEYLEILDRKAERLKDLIEDLFEVSKASSGNITLSKESVDVVALMKQTLLELEDKLEAAELVVKKGFPEGKVIVTLDSQRIFRVFENLVINITKYAMKGSRVYIDIIETEHSVEIIFKNMAAEEVTLDVESLVERFVRGDESRHTEGAGLGLAIAKSFVELHGGKLGISVDGDLFKVMIRLEKEANVDTQ